MDDEVDHVEAVGYLQHGGVVAEAAADVEVGGVAYVRDDVSVKVCQLMR